MNDEIPIIRYEVLDTGYCLASEQHILQGGERRQIACHALAILLHHPQQGWLLWDTGYAPRIFDVTRNFPFSLYRQATPLHIALNWRCGAIAALGLDA